MADAWTVVRMERPEQFDGLAIADDVFDKPLRRKRVDRFLADEGHALFCAVAANEIIGQLRLIIHHQPDRADDAYVDNLGVAAPWKRLGVATGLWRAALAYAQERGCRDIWVATEADNPEARGLYASLGLEERQISVFERRIRSRDGTPSTPPDQDA